MALCVQEIKSCGKMLPDGAEYCANCGAPQFDQCPHCENKLPLNTSQCPRCRHFLRCCPVCRKLYTLNQALCTNQEWGCANTPLQNFYSGYAMAGVDSHRRQSVIAANLQSVTVNASTQEAPFLWDYAAGQPISDLVTGYGRVFFVSEEERRVHSIAEENAVSGLTPRSPQVSASGYLDFPADSKMRDLMVTEGQVAFLAGPSPVYQGDQQARYGYTAAFRLTADTLEPKEQAVRDLYQTHCLTSRLWLLIRHDPQRQCSVVRALSLESGAELFQHPFPSGCLVDEHIPIVATNDAAYCAVTMNGEGFVYCIPFNGQPPAPITWYTATEELQIQAMAWGNGRLHVLVCDKATRQRFHLYYVAVGDRLPDDLTTLGLQREPVELEGIIRETLWLQENLIFVYSPSRRRLDCYDTANYLLVTELCHEFGGNGEVRRLLPVRTAKTRYFLTLITRSQRIPEFRLGQFGVRADSLLTGRDWKDPSFVCSNGRVFLYDRREGIIEAVKAFNP